MNRLSRRKWLGSAFGAAFVAATSSIARRASAAPSLDEALKKIGAARDGLKSLVGPFTQERTIGLLSSKVKSTGTITLVRPDRLRWELAPPDAVVYWVGPEGLAYKSARGGQGRVPPTQARVAEALDDLRVVLAGDLGALRARYDLALTGATDQVYSFSATPKDPAKTPKLKRIDFDLDASAVPRKVVLIEGPKDRTDIVFGALTVNGPVDARALRPDF